MRATRLLDSVGNRARDSRATSSDGLWSAQSMRYLAPARGTLTTALGLGEGYAERLDDVLARTGRADLELQAELLDFNAAVVARLDAHYLLSRRAEG